MTKARKQRERSGALKLTGFGITMPKEGHYELTAKFDEDTFCKAVFRQDQKHNDVAMRLRKLADDIKALRS